MKQDIGMNHHMRMNRKLHRRKSRILLLIQSKFNLLDLRDMERKEKQLQQILGLMNGMVTIQTASAAATCP